MVMARSFKLSVRSKRIALLVIVTIVGVFFVRIATQSWVDIRESFHAPSLGWVSIALGGFSAFYLFRVSAWQRILQYLGYPFSFMAAGRVLLLSEVTRYVPGNIWSILGRIGLSKEAGVPADKSFTATVVEVLATLTSAMLVGGALAVAAPQLPVWTKIILGLSLAAIVGILTSIRYVGRIVNWVLAKLQRGPLNWDIAPVKFLHLVLLYSTAWIGFSIGGYASAAAFVTLPASATVAILASMPLSWFIGYISFITPSGIGFREAAIVTMLNPIVGANAVIVAASSRFAVVLIELGWTGIFAWKHVRQAMVWMWRWIRTPRAVVCIACILFVLYFGTVTLVMQSKVITSRFDLGNMTQTVWNTSQGRFFEYTNPYGTNIASRYIHHADLLLILFAPIYWVYASPNVLLVAQVIIVALGGWLLYKFAKRVLGHEWLAAVLALSYLFYPTLQRAVLFDFHALTISATFAIGLTWAYVEQRWRWFMFFAILFALCKEELTLMLASFGLFMLWRHRTDRRIRRVALTTVLVSVVYFGATYFAIMPAARENQPSKYNVLYDVLGDSPSEIIQTVVHHPRLFAAMVLGKQARHMYAGQLGPVGFLPLASPVWLALAWPDYVVNLFNERIEPRLMIYHYQAAIGGFVFIATVFGVAALRKRFGPWWERNGRRLTRVSFEGVAIAFLVVAGGLESYRLSPLPYSQTRDMRAFWPSSIAPVIRAAVAPVPTDARVSATNTVGAQLAHRQYLYQFPQGIGDADYIFILLAKEGSLEWQRNHREAETLESDARYERIQRVKNFTVYRKR